MLMFLLQGTIIGVVGTIVGAIAGTAIADVPRSLSADHAFRATSIKSVICLSNCCRAIWLSVIVGAVVVCFVATLYPSRQAAQPRSGAGAAVRVAMAFVSVSGLNKFYTVRRQAACMCCAISILTVEKGEMVAIMGASGVGKSTLLHVLGGLDAIDSGQVRVGEHDIATMNDEARVAFRNRHIGFVFQFHHLLPEFTAIENAMMPLRIARVSAAEARPKAEALLQRVGLGDRLDHRPGMLSGGEQQRVAVSRALVMQPSLAAGRRADRRPR